MIIGYDFWLDGVYHNEEMIQEDNDGVSFDTCNALPPIDYVTLSNGTFDELHMLKNSTQMEFTGEKTNWSSDTIMLAKFQGDLVAGAIGVGGHPIKYIQLKRRKKGESIWQVYFTIPIETVQANDSGVYVVSDKYIESGETYEYCISPVAVDDNGNTIYGNNTQPKEIYVSYSNSHLMDNSTNNFNFDLIYDLTINDITNQMGANVIETLGSKYPYVVYNQNNYLKGSISCLLVSEQGATGELNIATENKLRKDILSFLTNKNYKILKGEDGTYLLIKITGTPTLTPLNGVMGIYRLSFEYTEIGDINNAETLKNLNFNYALTILLNNGETTTQNYRVGDMNDN